MEEIMLSYDEYIKVWQILEELRISLDRIGGYDEKEILKDKLFNYMTPGVYRKISEAADILESHLLREKSIELANGFQYYEE
jgi:hypothetical protein